jgi:WD40 repeat protein
MATFDRSVRRQLPDGRTDLLVVCDCGASGLPASIGWTGERCGPCHDRREEEGPTAETPSRVLFRSAKGSVGEFVFTRDEQLVALTGRNWIRSWDLADGRAEDFLVAGGRDVQGRRLSPDGALLLAWTEREFILYDRIRGQPGPLASVDVVPPFRAAFSPDGCKLAVTSRGRNVLVDLTGSASVRSWRTGWRAMSPDALAFDPDGRSLYAAAGFGTVSRVNLDAGEGTSLPAGRESSVLLSWMDESSYVSGLTCSLDGRWLAVSCWGDYGGGFRVHDLRTGQWSALLPERRPRSGRHHDHSDLGNHLAISPDSSILAVAGEKGLVSFRELPDSEIGRLVWGGSWLTSMAFSPDGQFLAVGEGETVRLWPWRRLLGAQR